MDVIYPLMKIRVVVTVEMERKVEAVRTQLVNYLEILNVEVVGVNDFQNVEEVVVHVGMEEEVHVGDVVEAQIHEGSMVVEVVDVHHKVPHGNGEDEVVGDDDVDDGVVVVGKEGDGNMD